MSAHDHPPTHVVAMGVSATGKSVVAARLADRLGALFVEGDAHHPPENVAKMASGAPLTDEDRLPWLRELARLLAEQHSAGRSVVLACSALRRSYRDVLRSAAPGAATFFVQLHAPYDALLPRISQRPGHFMPAGLLRSQLDTLEPLEPDEDGAVVDATGAVDEVVDAAEKAVRAHVAGGMLDR